MELIIKDVNGNHIMTCKVSKAKRSYTKFGEVRKISEDLIEYASWSGYYLFNLATGSVRLDSGNKVRIVDWTFEVI